MTTSVFGIVVAVNSDLSMGIKAGSGFETRYSPKRAITSEEMSKITYIFWGAINLHDQHQAHLDMYTLVQRHSLLVAFFLLSSDRR